MASYTPLDPSKNEVRMLKIVEPSDGPNSSLVNCILETVSLDDFTPDFKKFLNGAESKECNPDALKLWIDEVARGSVDPAITPLDLPYWRYALHYSISKKGLEEWDDLMEAIDIDPAQCSKIPSAFATMATTHDPTPKSTKSLKKHFSFAPRFKWGDYEAISYCWESETRDRKIVLNGSVIEVPRNLEAMLQRLRTWPDTKSGIKFWVDALCIDQGNVLEKNHQVKLMQTIYTRAFSLIVWLGVSSDDSDQAIDFIAGITHHTLNQTPHGEEEYGDRFLILGRGQAPRSGEPAYDLPWKSLLSFLSRNYWQRLWIIQELALNHNMTLFLCGKRSLSRSMILRACQFCIRHAETIDQSTPAYIKPIPEPGSYAYGSIWSTVYRAYCLLTLPDGETDEILTDDVLDLGRKANVKESVDKVYGILGLLPPLITKCISPDYSLGKDQVYFHFAKAMLNTFRRLDVLFSWCSYRPDGTLPSWIPDWSTKYERHHLYWLKMCKASGTKPAEYSIMDAYQSLHCRGFIFDAVQTMSGSLSETLGGRSRKATSSESPSTPVKNRYHGEAGVTAALRRTLVQNLTYSGDELHSRTTLKIYWIPEHDGHYEGPEVRKVMDSLKNIISSPCWEPFERFRQANADYSIFGFKFRDFFPVMDYPGQGNKDVDGIASSASPIELPTIISDHAMELDGNDALVMKRTTLTLEGRRLITTKSGYLGTAPEAVMKGDLLAIFFGCNYPVILRKFGNCYFLIGESYIDGVMDGELVGAMEGGEFEEIEFKLC
ncbi:heterokaryon incompatibility protein-domain-containing protein [Rhexocercosporidium sp. MPI-PUGE-AT-0058]|nr:heterokaryon incompatibility protein-domain-containing protein [Rhexocercosporidium sp. MPI-PUGE-AT-0058]